MRGVLVLIAALVLATNAARADCTNPKDNAQDLACLAQDLRDSDKRINAVYKVLMDGLDDGGKTALRDEQRQWLKRRDSACKLNNKETDRERWLQDILADQNKTVCVVRHTFDRVAQLDALLAAKSPTAPPLPPAPQAPPAPQVPQISPSVAAIGARLADLRWLDDGYVLQSLQQHHNGKYYYELWLDRGGIARLGDVLFTAGFRQTDSGKGVLSTTNVRRSQASLPPEVIGLAIDLDNGFVYLRHNGQWQEQPGSVGGTEVKLGRPYAVRLQGSTSMLDLIVRDLIRVNLGRQPFQYSLPDGYRPFAE
jgi:uncharacterized protein YecT (DUF1311 family)